MDARATNKMNRLIERADRAEVAARSCRYEGDLRRFLRRYQGLLDLERKLRKEAAELFINS
jgi:hypothetical protein